MSACWVSTHLRSWWQTDSIAVDLGARDGFSKHISNLERISDIPAITIHQIINWYQSHYLPSSPVLIWQVCPTFRAVQYQVWSIIHYQSSSHCEDPDCLQYLVWGVRCEVWYLTVGINSHHHLGVACGPPSLLPGSPGPRGKFKG